MLIRISDPALVLLVGPSGAGKSTFAARSFKPTEIVSSDTIRAMLTDDPGDQDSSAQAFHLVALMVNGRLSRRRTTVIDATNLRAANRKRYRQMAARYEVPTVAIAFALAPTDYGEWNARRPDRVVDAQVVADQAARMVDTIAALGEEQYAQLVVLRSTAEVTDTTVERSAR